MDFVPNLFPISECELEGGRTGCKVWSGNADFGLSRLLHSATPYAGLAVRQVRDRGNRAGELRGTTSLQAEAPPRGSGDRARGRRGCKAASESRATKIWGRLLAWKQTPGPQKISLRAFASQMGTPHQLLTFLTLSRLAPVGDLWPPRPRGRRGTSCAALAAPHGLPGRLPLAPAVQRAAQEPNFCPASEWLN